MTRWGEKNRIKSENKTIVMIPVMQTKVVVKNTRGETVVRGNCYAACIASILEVPITEVPNVEVLFNVNDSYWAEVMHTFLNSIGWELCADDRYRCFHDDDGPFGTEKYLQRADNRVKLQDKYYLVSGNSPRGVVHMCIYQNGKLVHDPHPSKDGLMDMLTFQDLCKAGK